MELLTGGIGILFVCFLFLVPTAIWIWAIVDAAKSEFKDGNTKIVWVLIIVLLPFIGTILYFAIGRSQRMSS